MPRWCWPMRNTCSSNTLRHKHPCATLSCTPRIGGQDAPCWLRPWRKWVSCRQRGQKRPRRSALLPTLRFLAFARCSGSNTRSTSSTFSMACAKRGCPNNRGRPSAVNAPPRRTARYVLNPELADTQIHAIPSRSEYDLMDGRALWQIADELDGLREIFGLQHALLIFLGGLRRSRLQDFGRHFTR